MASRTRTQLVSKRDLELVDVALELDRLTGRVDNLTMMLRSIFVLVAGNFGGHALDWLTG